MGWGLSPPHPALGPNVLHDIALGTAAQRLYAAAPRTCTRKTFPQVIPLPVGPYGKLDQIGICHEAEILQVFVKNDGAHLNV